ncbi:MAG TPA: hypothetical protein VKS79_21085 [Gemmataceae bacterium]|nr:hypothetical protein [Gemmataceae bacterium]
MASPSMTFNALGNIVSNASVAASGTRTDAVDGSTKFETQVQVDVTFGTVAATNGFQVQVFRRFGAGPTDDTIAIVNFTIAGVGSTTVIQSFALPTGKYDIKVTNLDATNGVTGYYLTTSTVDSIA